MGAACTSLPQELLHGFLERLAATRPIEKILIPWTVNIATAAAVWFVGKWAISRITAIAKAFMGKGGMNRMLGQFLGNVLQTVLLIVLVIAALDMLDVKTTSVLAIFGAASLVIGLALKDSHANFSSGVMLIIFRPFKAGDFIEAAGVVGLSIPFPQRDADLPQQFSPSPRQSAITSHAR